MNKTIPFFIVAWLLSAACNRKLSRAEVKDHLEKAMADHLQQRQPKNTPHPKFDVLDVEWFEEIPYYKCEFKIRMTLPDGKDTTGIMKQRVSKDFSKVE
jgi:hypothetical protein